MSDVYQPKNMPWSNYVIKPPTGDVDTKYKEEICNFWDDSKFYVNLDDVTTSAPAEETTSGAASTKMSCIVMLVCVVAGALRMQ